MNRRRIRRSSWLPIAILCTAVATTAPTLAKKGVHGGGNTGSNDKGGEATPVKITFADEYGLDEGGQPTGSRISGDGAPYVHDADGTGDLVEAYLGGGGARGDIFLRLANAPSRGLWLDFSDCDSSCGDPPPYSMYVDPLSTISVAPGDVGYRDGLFGMAAGEAIEAPMDMYYEYGTDGGPGYIYFNEGLKGKGNNPCHGTGMSSYVTITRPSADQVWVVSADSSVLACVRLPGGGELSGAYLMPFEFTVEVLPAP